MATFEEIAAQYNDPYAPQPIPEVPVMSLAQQKKASLFSKALDKQAKLDPQSAITAFDRLNANAGRSDSLANFALSSLGRAGGNLYDAGGTAINSIFGTDINVSREDGLSDQANADQFGGLSLAARKQLTDDQDAVGLAIKENRWGDALTGAAGAGFRTAADSAGSFAEIAAGTALTALAPPVAGILGGGLLAKKAINTVDAVKDVKNRVDKLDNVADATTDVAGAAQTVTKATAAVDKVADAAEAVEDVASTAKSASILSKSLSLAGKGVKSASQVSLVTADIVQQQREEYFDKYGEYPTPQRVAGMTALTLATTMAYPSIIKNLFIPKLRGAGGKNLKEALVNETKALIKYAKASTIGNIGRRVVDTTLKVAAAGGAEAVQEYAQTWAGIIGENVGRDEATSMLTSLFNEFAKQENIDETITSAFLGGAAGSATRGGIAAPSLAIGSTVDVVKGTVRYTGDKAAKQVAKAKFSNLSPQKQKQLKDDFRIASAKHDEVVADRKEKLRTLNKTHTFESIEDEALRKAFYDVANPNADLTDPATFKRAKALVKQVYNSDMDVSELALQKNKYWDLAEAHVSAVADKININVPKLKQRLRILTKKTKRELANLPYSRTAGLLDRAADHAQELTKEAAIALEKEAVLYSVDQLRKTADFLREDMPQTSALLERSANKIEQTEIKAGLRRAELKNYDALTFEVKDVAKRGKISSSPISVGTSIQEDSRATLESVEAVNTLSDALKVYKDTPLFKEQRKGSLSVEEVATIEKSLKARSKELEESVPQRVRRSADKVVGSTGRGVDWAAGVTSEAVEFAAKGVESLIDTFLTPPTDTKASTEAETTTEVKDPDSKKKYVVTYNATVAQFVKGFNEERLKINALKTPEEKKEAVKIITTLLSDPNLINNLRIGLDTQDNNIVAAFIQNLMGDYMRRKPYEAFLKTLKDTEIPNKNPPKEIEEETANLVTLESGKISLNDEGDFLVQDELKPEDLLAMLEHSHPDLVCKS